MARAEAAHHMARIFALLCGVVVFASLYFLRDVLLPFALAILLSFLLAPFVSLLEKWKFPRIVAVLCAVILCFASLAVLSSAVVRQLYNVASHLPDYKINLINKTRAFQTEGG